MRPFRNEEYVAGCDHTAPGTQQADNYLLNDHRKRGKTSECWTGRNKDSTLPGPLFGQPVNNNNDACPLKLKRASFAAKAAVIHCSPNE